MIASGKFWHIFQLKAVGADDIDGSPMMTLTLTDILGLHIRVMRDDHDTNDRFHIMPLSDATGRWFQVMVESQFSANNDSRACDAGYVRVVLKDENGVQLYPIEPEDDGVIFNDMFWIETDFVRPKWG